ncbi:MAG: NfeD family protein [Natronomonas sp.]|jgi:membrane protein implicated in regulation of membrane protease activity|uniref:NfeD family protein n=1 Tax=Natronomonas salsuginis TaxID=2217661 RepID=A0A4U5J6D6_9EURY|nr:MULTISPECIES: NfeD family protein [Natronomonas]MDR9381210.1 NfeD family protein [Natronomonas sp.]MDR9429743.1 NfeD family protein [Natronomonas sp.]TKR24572.1 NfeD family protein [Natronomonas salsuginis]
MAELFGLSLPFFLILVGAALMVMEAFAPGAHFIVVGIALLAAGLVGLLLGSILPAAVLPIVLAAIVLVAGGVALYGYRQFDFYGGKGTGQTSDSKSLQGKTGRVTQRVTKSDGEVKLESGGFNPYYQARALDGEITEGEEVMVVDPGGGNVLTVESLSAFKDEIDEELAADRTRREGENGERDPESEGEPA